MKRYSCLIIIISILFYSCRKEEEWFDVKSTKSDVVPATLKDFQALLDNSTLMNTNYPSLGMLSADNFYITYTTWQAAGNPIERNGYLWQPDIFQGSSADWAPHYSIIIYANVVLEGIDKLGSEGTNPEGNAIKGSALFLRAQAFFNLAQLFAKPYDPSSAVTDPGIPLKLNSDVNAMADRGSVKDTYDQIQKDLSEALTLLPASPQYQTRPGQAAAQLLLARVLVDRKQYADAKAACDASLSISNAVIDYNTLTASAALPFSVYPNNKEVIFWAQGELFGITSAVGSRGIVDTTLYNSYAANDLRKTVFYAVPNTTGQVFFKGHYTGSNMPFAGLAVNETYLLRAECLARTGNTAGALADLNALLSKRWKTGTYQPLQASTPDQALQYIVTERRKEFPFTGNLRWMDLRRFNQEPAFARTLKRVLNNTTYTLLPNDKLYVMPIPDIEIKLSGIAQNSRL